MTGLLFASTSHRLIAVGALTALLAATAVHAQAVHKCRIDGRFVYQSAICPAEPQAPAAPASSRAPTAAPVALAATQPSAPKKKTLAELLHDRDGATPTAPAARDVQGDGANILRSRMGAV